MNQSNIFEALEILRDKGIELDLKNLLEEIKEGNLKLALIDGDYYISIVNFAKWLEKKG